MPSSPGEGLLIISGLIAVQVVFAVYTVLLARVLSLGLSPLFLVIIGNLANSVFLLPFAIVLERRKWPTRLGLTLLAQFGLIAFGGVTAFQALMMLGIKKTSPAIASAMPNLGPGLIFIIAACLRFEKFEIRNKYTRVKVLGTLVCLGGAIALCFLRSPPVSASPTFYEDWSVGCFYILAAIVIVSFSTVLQAATLMGFPAPFSLYAMTCLMASTFTALLQIITEGKLDVGSPVNSITSIMAFILVSGAVTSLCTVFQIWCISRKGPVFVSIFGPIQTVCSAVLSALMLRQVISLGSLAGIFIIFGGLYMFLWAKRKEDCNLLDADDNAKLLLHGIKKPLLS